MHYLEDDAQPYKRMAGATWDELNALVRASPRGSSLDLDNLAVAAVADRYPVVEFGTDEQVLATDARIISRCVESYLWHVKDNLSAIYRLLTHPDTLNDGRVYYGIIGVHHRSIIESAARLKWLVEADASSDRLTRFILMLNNDGRITEWGPLVNATSVSDVESLRRQRQPVKKAAVESGGATGGVSGRPRDVVESSFGREMLTTYDQLSQFVHHSVNQDAILSGAPFSRGLKGVGADDYDEIHREFSLKTVLALNLAYVAVERYASP